MMPEPVDLDAIVAKFGAAATAPRPLSGEALRQAEQMWTNAFEIAARDVNRAAVEYFRQGAIERIQEQAFASARWHALVYDRLRSWP